MRHVKLGPLRHAVCAAGLLLAAAPPARAADVVTEPSSICPTRPSSPLCLTNVYFRAAPGEANRVSTRRDGAEMVVGETAAPLAAGAGCRSVSPTEVRCALREGRGRMWVYAGDGNDKVEMRALGIAYGGSGRDELRNVGRLGHVRTLFGGPGNDLLVGSADQDVLDGDAGDDRIYGRGGNDDLYGGPGRDLIVAGAGNDRVFAADGDRDTVRCGAGRDEARADRRDRLTNCERVKRR